MKILIAGSSGLIGTALQNSLAAEGHDIFLLSRSVSFPQGKKIPWDPQRGQLDPALVEGFDGIINLAGENVSQRWTSARKKMILESRTAATSLLASTLSKLAHPPKVLINASAIGYYGNRGNELLDEASASGSGFLAQVCRSWESSAQQAKINETRIVLMRFGVVLSPEGGALKKMLLPFKLGLGGRIGSGNQYVSWIAIDDLVKAISFCLNNVQIEGPINVTSPEPVTNAQLTEILGKQLDRPTFMSMPSFFVKLILGEMGEEMLLSSSRVIPKKLLEQGFTFQYPELKNALSILLKR